MKLKLLVLILCVVNTTVYAQTKEEIKAKAFFWGENDAYHDKTEVPEKWKNESAVILYKNENYDFHKFGKNVTYTQSVRKRIKLQDKNAVDEFSEFTFKKRFRASKGYKRWRLSGNNIVGIKIIKSNGKEIIIDVNKEAVEVDGETKLAISNLEVGDILDYYFYKLEPIKSKSAFGFDPVETTLSEEYPIVDYHFFLETENDFFINFKSFNGAPELKQIETEKNNLRRYELKATDVQKSNYPIWIYPLVELPSYKFQVFFARSGKFENRAIAFLPEKEKIIKKNVSKEEVLDLYDTRFKPSGNVGDVKDFFKGKSFSNDSEKVTEAYYYMRHYYLTRYIEAAVISNANIIYYPYSYYDHKSVFIKNERQFVRHFTEFLKRHKINYEIVVAKKRYDGSINELLLESNLNVLLKVHTSPPLYVKYFDSHTSVNQYSPLIENTEVYLLSKTKSKIDKISDGKMPMSTYKDNESKKELVVTINDDFSGTSITSTNSYKGHLKSDIQSEYLMFTDFVHEDYKKYGTKSFTERVRKKKLKLKVNNELNALIEDRNKNKKEKFEAKAKNALDLNEINNYEFEIIKTGRYGFDSYLVYNESFDTKNTFIKRAGGNYILDIGKLIGGQINIDENGRTRTVNVHMAHPRVYNISITLNIPKGYSVSGVEKLRKSVDNITGAFISTAKIVGDKLIITTTKQYKHNFEPKENWNLMLEFLDEALQFTNEKILLKKL